MISLVEKMRHIHRVVQNINNKPVSFQEMSVILSTDLNCNCYILDYNAKILNYCWCSDLKNQIKDSPPCQVIEILENNKSLPFNNISELKSFRESTLNISQSDKKCHLLQEHNCPFDNLLKMIVPIENSDKRLGTLIFIKRGEEFSENDLILAEYGASLIGMEISRLTIQKQESEDRKISSIKTALETLSYSELDAMKYIINELNGSKGLIVASKVADKVGITRSVIVNALRKFESAGVIESKSLGMKGTYIKITNDRLIEELEKFELF